jgi:hypothetical protein
VVWTSILAFNAAINNHLELAKWLNAEIGLKSPTAKQRSKLFAIYFANVAMLEWVIELGAHIRAADIRKTARYGHVHILEWVATVWNVYVIQSLMTPAIRSGNLEVVKWLARQPGVNLSASGCDIEYAPAPLISWVLKNLEVENKESLARGINAAAGRNDLELVKLLHENSNGGSCTTSAMDNAAKAGHLKIVKWLHKNRREGWTTKAMDDAASGEHLDVVELLHENRREGCTTQAMDGAAKHGHLEIVKWRHAHRTDGQLDGHWPA